jgi:membrane protein implicated in regulation of membrane protease activity
VLLGMLRDNWWWPWWVSTLIDLGVVALALIFFRKSRRRAVKAAAGVFILAGLVAAVMAPIVMTEKSGDMKPGETPMMR